jgi:DNA-directed RNA polymerase subunit L
MKGKVWRARSIRSQEAEIVLEDENATLKKLLAEAMLDDAMLKDIAGKRF